MVPVTVSLAAALLVGLTGCMRSVGPVALTPSSPQTLPSDDLPLSDPSRVLPASPTAPGGSATVSPGATGFPQTTAAPCAGRPSAATVLAALRRVPGLLPSSPPASVRTGPLCAGTWQYTIVEVTGREPLQVLTRGTPDAPVLVTAGTNICTDDVRATAPTGILTLARC